MTMMASNAATLFAKLLDDRAPSSTRMFKSLAANAFEEVLEKAKTASNPSGIEGRDVLPHGSPSGKKRLAFEDVSPHLVHGNEIDMGEGKKPHVVNNPHESLHREGYAHSQDRMHAQLGGEEATKHFSDANHPDWAIGQYKLAHALHDPHAPHNEQRRAKRGEAGGAITAKKQGYAEEVHEISKNQHTTDSKNPIKDLPASAPEDFGHEPDAKHVEHFATKMTRASNRNAGMNRLFAARQKNPNATHAQSIEEGPLSKFSGRVRPPVTDGHLVAESKHNPLASGDFKADGSYARKISPHYQDKSGNFLHGDAALRSSVDINQHLNSLPVGENRAGAPRQAIQIHHGLSAEEMPQVGKHFVTPAIKAIVEPRDVHSTASVRADHAMKPVS